MIFSCSDFQRIQKSESIEDKYEAAIKYYEEQDYYRSGLLLEELIPITRGTDNAERSLFYYAYCHYHQDQLYLASVYFSNLTSTYPRSEFAEESRYMYARSMYEGTPKYNLDQSQTMETLSSLQGVINAYPNSEYVEECDIMIDDLNYRREKKAYENALLYHKLSYFKSAVIALDNFANDFPTSSYVEEVSFLKVESQFKLAKKSIVDKKKDRYLEVVTYYQDFVDKFPSSTFVRQAENMYDQTLNNIEKLNNN